MCEDLLTIGRRIESVDPEFKCFSRRALPLILDFGAYSSFTTGWSKLSSTWHGPLLATFYQVRRG